MSDFHEQAEACGCNVGSQRTSRPDGITSAFEVCFRLGNLADSTRSMGRAFSAIGDILRQISADAVDTNDIADTAQRALTESEMVRHELTEELAKAKALIGELLAAKQPDADKLAPLDAAPRAVALKTLKEEFPSAVFIASPRVLDDDTLERLRVAFGKRFAKQPWTGTPASTAAGLYIVPDNRFDGTLSLNNALSLAGIPADEVTYA